MAYKYATGSVQRGDIYDEDDVQGNTYIDWASSGDALGIVVGGTTNFVVSASNVGIGTSSPDAKLEVYHNADDEWAALFTQDHTTGWGVKITGDMTGGDPLLKIMSEDTDTVFRVQGNGNVGIGTNSPDYTLDIAGTVGIDDYIYHNGDEDTYLKFEGNEVNLVAGGQSMIKLDYNNNANDKIQLNNTNANIDVQIMADDGGVILHTDAGTNRAGIGETSPTSTFEISGSQAGNYTSITGDRTLGETEYIVDYTGNGDATITLPDVSGITGRMYYIISHAQGENDALTITGSGGQFQGPNLEEGDSDSIEIEGWTPQSVTIVSTGGNWFLLEDNRSQHEE